MKIILGRERPTIEKIAALCGGRLLPGDRKGIRVSSVCTDSREAGKGSLFLAIRGAKTDGHRYLRQVSEAGGACAIAEYIPEDRGGLPLILVDSTVAALGRFAKAYSAGDEAKRIAVTGSVGKTTTKEMTACVIGGGCFRSEGNFNSVIGMPMSLLSVAGSPEYEVFELGLEEAGEISYMSSIIRPSVAVITNVGSSHLEHIGSREKLVREKLSVADHIPSDGKLFVGTGSEDLIDAVSGDPRVSFFSGDPTGREDFFAENAVESDGGQTFDIIGPDRTVRGCRIEYYGEHNRRAAVSAAAVGMFFGFDDDQIRQGLERFRSVGMRQRTERIAGITIINDCYNASPESMRAACRLLSRTAEDTHGRRIALLGDMFELGENSDRWHRETGRFFAENGTDVLVTFGKSAQLYSEGAEGIIPPDRRISFTDPSDVHSPAAALAEILRPGDVLIVKASNGMHAERVSAELAQMLGGKTKGEGQQ